MFEHEARIEYVRTRPEQMRRDWPATRPARYAVGEWLIRLGGGPAPEAHRPTPPPQTLPRRGDQRDGSRKEDAHGISERTRLLVRPAGRAHLLQRGRGQLDCGVKGQSRELLALSLLHRLRLLLGELAQAAHQILGISAERKAKPAASFHRSPG